MLDRAVNFLRSFSSRKVIITLSGLGVVLNVFFLSPSYRLLQEEAPGVGMPDLQPYYSPVEAYEMLHAYGDTGREVYGRFLVTTDLVWPVVYALILSLLTFALLRKTGVRPGSRLQWTGLLPAGALLFDLLENAGMLGMLATYPGYNPALATLASVSTTAKWAFIGLSGLIILTLTTKSYINYRKEKRKAQPSKPGKPENSR